MSTLQQLQEGFGRAWDSLSEGWHHLTQRAAQALTHFTPLQRRGELQTADERVMLRAAHWGLIAAEVEETADDIIVRIEAPGMEADDFDIGVVDDVLRVCGEKRLSRQEQRGRYTLMECAYGRFERAVPLPGNVDEARSSAQYRRGVLTVRLPKTPAARARRIDVLKG